MQLKNYDSELIKEEIFNQTYKGVLQGDIKDPKTIHLVFKYFAKNPNQLFKLHHQEEEQKPIINYHQNKICYSCGIKGHIKRNCKLQGLTGEEEIEFVFSKKPSCRNCIVKGHWEEDCPYLIKKKELFEPEEVSFNSIPCDLPYDLDPYED
jgi:hypothetical protein